MDQALDLDLNRKLDLLTTQVQFLTEQAQVAARERQERAELMNDVMPIANQAFQLTTEQLEEVQEYVDLGDLLRILKRLLRNGRHLDTLLDQLESVMDLVQTVGPLTDQAFEKAVDVMQEAEHKGYFALARGGMRIADNVVTSFTEDDARKLGDSVQPALNLVKDLAQPEVIGLLGNIVSDAKREVAKPVGNVSLPGLLGQMRDPQVRRGLALTLRLLRVIGARAAVG